MKKHIKLISILAFFLILLSVSSCELGFKVDKPKIYVLAWGHTYTESSFGNLLSINDCEYKNYGMSGFLQIDGYSGNLGKLANDKNDAEDIAKTFELLAKKAGYSFKNYTITCTDPLNSTGYDVGNYDNYLTKLEEIKIQIKDSDILICYFSGHGVQGSQIGQDENKGYVVFSKQVVDYDLIKADISALRGTKFIIADTCHSGAIVETENGVMVNPDISAKNPIKILFKSKIRESANFFSFVACTINQESQGGNSGGNSVFTASVLKALGGGRNISALENIGALKNNTLTVYGIVKYVLEDETKYSNQTAKQSNHIPLISGRSDDIILFKF